MEKKNYFAKNEEGSHIEINGREEKKNEEKKEEWKDFSHSLRMVCISKVEAIRSFRGRPIQHSQAQMEKRSQRLTTSNWYDDTSTWKWECGPKNQT